MNEFEQTFDDAVASVAVVYGVFHPNRGLSVLFDAGSHDVAFACVDEALSPFPEFLSESKLVCFDLSNARIIPREVF